MLPLCHRESPSQNRSQTCVAVLLRSFHLSLAPKSLLESPLPYLSLFFSHCCPHSTHFITDSMPLCVAHPRVWHTLASISSGLDLAWTLPLAWPCPWLTLYTQPWRSYCASDFFICKIPALHLTGLTWSRVENPLRSSEKDTVVSSHAILLRITLT